MRFLLDTNIVSNIVREPRGRVTRHIRMVGEAAVCTSIIVAAELRYGAAKSGSARLARQLDQLLDAFEILPIETPADVVYGRLRLQLERGGRPIGGNDLLIAAQAISLGHTIVTDNEREFARIGDLRWENWLRGD